MLEVLVPCKQSSPCLWNSCSEVHIDVCVENQFQSQSPSWIWLNTRRDSLNFFASPVESQPANSLTVCSRSLTSPSFSSTASRRKADFFFHALAAALLIIFSFSGGILKLRGMMSNLPVSHLMILYFGKMGLSISGRSLDIIRFELRGSR